MQRRGFLKTLLSATAFVGLAAEVDTDKLLWVPGRKAFSIPEHPKIQPPDFAHVRESIAQAFDRHGIFTRDYDVSHHDWLKRLVPDETVPRYTITVGVGDVLTPVGVYHLDDDWKVVGGVVLVTPGTSEAAPVYRAPTDADINHDVKLRRHWMSMSKSLSKRWENEPRDLVYARDAGGKIRGDVSAFVPHAEVERSLQDAINHLKRGRV